jgi:hypothetical protein
MKRARASAMMCGPAFMLLASCSLEPGFSSLAQGKSITCRHSASGEAIDVTLSGHEAVVIDQDRRIILRFVSSIWPRTEDRYEGEGHVLTFDPEGRLHRPDGSSFGPCQ